MTLSGNDFRYISLSNTTQFWSWPNADFAEVHRTFALPVSGSELLQLSVSYSRTHPSNRCQDLRPRAIFRFGFLHPAAWTLLARFSPVRIDTAVSCALHTFYYWPILIIFNPLWCNPCISTNVIRHLIMFHCVKIITHSRSIPRLKRDPKFLQTTNVAHVCTTCNRLPSLLVGKAARHFPPKNGSAGHQNNAGFSVIVTQRSYVAE